MPSTARYHAMAKAAQQLKARQNGAAKAWPKLTHTLGSSTNHPAIPQSPASARLISIDPAHNEPMGTWSSEKMAQSRRDNPYMMTWAPGKERGAVPIFTHGKGVYLYDENNKQYLDWTSQAVCNNLGHTLPDAVIQAAAQQMATMPFVYGGMGVPEVRVRFNQLMAEVLPGDLRPAVFPSSGAEANEAGIMMARRYTGRHKIISWYRSYHGATASAGAASGDFRRWYGSDNNTGFIKAFNPFPLFFNHGGNNATEEERVQSALAMLEEQILNEGPDNIASIVMEPIVGAGGCLIMPPGYLQGVRSICDEYGILMHLDEVMVGFGRTGKMFGFENYKDVMPDIVSAGKGIAGAAIPLSMTACSSKIMEHFENIPLGWGSTYQAHPVALAAAYENVKYLVNHDIVGHVQRLSSVFEKCMQLLADKHACIKQHRSIGLFGCFDVQDIDGGNPKLQHKPAFNQQAFADYKKAFAENGLVGLHRYPHIHSAPPLIITQDELVDGFDRLDRAITVLNRSLGHPERVSPGRHSPNGAFHY